jgi:hypothetical protein
VKPLPAWSGSEVSDVPLSSDSESSGSSDSSDGEQEEEEGEEEAGPARRGGGGGLAPSLGGDSDQEVGLLLGCVCILRGRGWVVPTPGCLLRQQHF